MTSSTRTDVHSPANLITEDYEYVECYDNEIPMGGCPLTGDPRILAAWRAAMDAHRERMGRLRALVATSVVDRGLSQCHHCGARLRYGAVLRHVPTGTHIAVGETCLENRIGRATVDFQAARKGAELDRAQQRIVKARAAYLAENPDLAWIDGELPEIIAGNPFVQDVCGKFRRYGELSPKQADALRNAMVKAVERANAPAVPETPKADAPTGRVLITGTVCGTKWVENDFGGTLKLMVCVEENGAEWKLWVTCPSSLDCERGDVIRMKVTVRPSDDDPAFAFGSRPSNAETVTAVSAA